MLLYFIRLVLCEFKGNMNIETCIEIEYQFVNFGFNTLVPLNHQNMIYLRLL